MSELADHLGPVSVLSMEGRPVLLSTLWAETTAVIIWLRHYG